MMEPKSYGIFIKWNAMQQWKTLTAACNSMTNLQKHQIKQTILGTEEYILCDSTFMKSKISKYMMIEIRKWVPIWGWG